MTHPELGVPVYDRRVFSPKPSAKWASPANANGGERRYSAAINSRGSTPNASASLRIVPIRAGFPLSSLVMVTRCILACSARYCWLHALRNRIAPRLGSGYAGGAPFGINSIVVPQRS
jgi:hypothetical protein